MRVIAIYTLYCGGQGSKLVPAVAIITRGFPQAISDIETELHFRCFAYLKLMTEFLCGLRFL